MGDKSEEVGFFDYFSGLEDPRMDRTKLYPMSELLFTTICAVTCGAEGWSDVELFTAAPEKQTFLKEHYPYANGFPSDDTYRRFFRALNAEAFAECFRRLMNDALGEGNADHIAIDGKTHRGSRDGGEDALHMISAFASESRLVLAQTGREGKGHELSGIKEVLKWLNLKGTVVSMDALGTQRAVAQTIVDGQGDYVLALKENQKTLHEDVREYFEFPDGVIETFKDFDKGHGRLETRICEASSDVKLLQLSHAWPGLRSIVKVTCRREVKGKESEFIRYYVSSLNAGAEKMLGYVRSHWSIENNLHWVLDMSFGEDASRIRKENAPMVMGVLRHLVVNMIKSVKGKRESIKGLRKAAGWSNEKLNRILNAKIETG